MSHGPITFGGTATTYLPMTTTWASIAACSTLFIQPDLGSEQIFAFDPNFQNHEVAPACMPPEAYSWWYQSQASGITTSIGGYTMKCPGLYTTAGTSDMVSSTLIGCCPSGYSFQSWDSAAYPGQCASTLPAQVVTYVAPISTGASSFTTTSRSISASVVYGVQINGLLFASPTSTSGSSTSSSSFSTPSVTATPTSTPIPVAAARNSGLPQGAKIGIGIGVGLAVVGLLALASVVLLARRRKREEKPEEENLTAYRGMYEAPKPYIPDHPQEMGTPAPQYEMMGNQKPKNSVAPAEMM